MGEELFGSDDNIYIDINISGKVHDAHHNRFLQCSLIISLMNWIFLSRVVPTCVCWTFVKISIFCLNSFAR